MTKYSIAFTVCRGGGVWPRVVSVLEVIVREGFCPGEVIVQGFMSWNHSSALRSLLYVGCAAFWRNNKE